VNGFDFDALRDPVPPLPDAGRRAAVDARARSLRARSGVNRLALSSVSVVAVVALVLGVVASQHDDNGPQVIVGGPSTTAPSSIANRLVPPTSTIDGVTTLPVTLPDGETTTLSYPEELRIAQLGFAGGIGVNWDVDPDPLRCCGKQVSVTYDTIEHVYANATPLKVYRGANGESVPYFRASQQVPPQPNPINYLVFQFGPWLVQVYDVQEAGDFERPMTDDERTTFSRSLTGTLDANGFLVLHAALPLSVDNAFDGGFGAQPGNHLELASHLYCGQAPAGGDSTDHRRFRHGDGTPGVAWCTDDLHVSATGTNSFVDLVDRGLRVSPLNPAPTADSVVLLTQAHGYNQEASMGSGSLRFDAERNCAYLERPDGTRLLPQWPEGYHARRDPLRVYDAANTLVATEGHVITFGGGYHDPAQLGPDAETCGVHAVDGLFIMGQPIQDDRATE
jgi:hypothetical protein